MRVWPLKKQPAALPRQKIDEDMYIERDDEAAPAMDFIFTSPFSLGSRHSLKTKRKGLLLLLRASSGSRSMCTGRLCALMLVYMAVPQAKARVSHKEKNDARRGRRTRTDGPAFSSEIIEGTRDAGSSICACVCVCARESRHTIALVRKEREIARALAFCR